MDQTNDNCERCHNTRKVLVGFNFKPCPKCRYFGWALPWFLTPTGHSLVHPRAKDPDGGPQLTKGQT